MHIPDGYLSPSTCAVLYAAAIAGWYSALKRLKRMLLNRVIPLISVFAAFSFVVMMFNLPLPGGTTGHALGVTISAIVLGPSGSILAISIALAIQALFFGDGGISTLGANCFNMAIVASLVAYGSYRGIAAGAGIVSRRRVVAAAIAGYLAVNAAALIAAIEFGIQPALFHDARGMPLYAPYPLSIAVPAMMIGHLTLAGVAEAVISAGLVAYLQAADPALLRNTAGALPATEAASTSMPAEELAAKIMDRSSSANGAHSAGNPGGGKSLGRVVSLRACDAAKPRNNFFRSDQFHRLAGGSHRNAAALYAVDGTVSGVCASFRKKCAVRLFSFRHIRRWYSATESPWSRSVGLNDDEKQAVPDGARRVSCLNHARLRARFSSRYDFGKDCPPTRALAIARPAGARRRPFRNGRGGGALAENRRGGRFVCPCGDYCDPV